MGIIFLELSVISSIVGYVWVNELTQNRQLFDFVRVVYGYLPSKVKHALDCDKCTSGWINIVLVWLITKNLVLLVLAPFFAIFTVVVIKRILR